ncbi:EF hand domain-containing protein [Arthroderma uncinatum]|uniref:EF hand domain-containing protein n=1 Tax=Arthroderma uncinatum TaxID=74035 RepID=UPI00144A6197|nr:EF hand domain-containing protein [Arthroderma uncinatum]KAF3479422.1 EF hand domain-containing protein [Arthroderma uncinatum]
MAADTSQHPNLNLTPEEKRVFYQLFQTADKTNLGVITGETAVTFFEKTNLAPETLGLIWQIADTQNRGLLTPSGFGIVMRLIGHAQAGRQPSEELALQPGPLPSFAGLNIDPQTASSPPPNSAPLRVPPLNPDDVAKFSALFNKSDTQNGVISGETAKQIFERARLPNEILGRIWNLADSTQRGALDSAEFIIAMHLLTAYKSGTLRGIPPTLPPGLYEAAARTAVTRNSTGSRSDVPPVPAIPKQFSGPGAPRAQSPLSQMHTGGDWLITPQDKAHFDSVFATVDKARSGYINGDQAVGFFTNARLQEEVLAHIWDLSDIDSDGQLSRDEFAVAMYLVRQQRTTKEPLPQTLPPNLIPPSMRRLSARAVQPQSTGARSATEDLFGLDVFTAPTQIPQSTGGSSSHFQPPSSPTRQIQSSTFKPFVPASSFGQSLGPITGGRSTPGMQHISSASPSDDLLGDADPEESKKLTQETTDLANLSNQVGTLSKEMQNIQTKRGTAEQDIGQVDHQKKEFEARLAQARAMYENEVKSLKALEERLTTSRAECKKLEQEYALIEASRRDLATQYSQMAAALEADQRENASLKEKIKQANAQTSQLKPQLEKTRSEARQQKGLVAINKKQLATVEAERDRLQEELDQYSQHHEGSERDVTAPGSHNSPFESPTASTSSAKNPFFRRGTGMSSPGALSPQATGQKQQQENDNRNVFDNMFGPSFTAPSTSTPPPQTTFRAASPQTSTAASKESFTPEGGRVASSSGNFTPSTAFDSQFGAPSEPPAPPLSRQITPNNLPLEGHIASVTSSNRPSPPASRFGTSVISDADAFKKQASPFDEEPIDEDATPGGNDAKQLQQAEDPEPDLPGAFPTNTTPQPEQTKKDVSFDELFANVGHARSPSQKASDFDEAFASMKKPASKGDGEKTKSNGSAAAEGNEFPPIREFEVDDDDDDSSDDDHAGFDDDFAPASPPRQTSPPSQASKDAPQKFSFPPIEALSNPTSPPSGANAQNNAPGATQLGTISHQPSASIKKAANPDFEAAFAGLDLTPAKEIEDDGDDDDDDFETAFNKDASNFDISFDSPSGPPKHTSNSSSADFFSFQSNTGGNANPAAVASQNGKSPFSQDTSPATGNNASSNHDWDALFSTLDSTKVAAGGGKEAAKLPSGEQAKPGDASTISFPQPPSQNKPAGWALDSNTGEDDMILQRLTGMGYPRDEALAALEKFDYKLDEAADFLASKS